MTITVTSIKGIHERFNVSPPWNSEGREGDREIENGRSCRLNEDVLDSETYECRSDERHECRSDERLKTKTEEFTLLTHTGFLGGLEHLKIERRLIDEKFANAMGEYVTWM